MGRHELTSLTSALDVELILNTELESVAAMWIYKPAHRDGGKVSARISSSDVNMSSHTGPTTRFEAQTVGNAGSRDTHPLNGRRWGVSQQSQYPTFLTAQGPALTRWLLSHVWDPLTRGSRCMGYGAVPAKGHQHGEEGRFPQTKSKLHIGSDAIP